jgi:hypothetical protein
VDQVVPAALERQPQHREQYSHLAVHGPVGRVLGLLVGHVLADGVDRKIGEESPAEERMR